jgi:putative flippase GtrA
MSTTARSTRELLGGLVRYGLVGLANAATYYGTYLLAHPRAGYLVAHTVGLGTAMVVSFFLNCRFTFRVRPTWTRFLLYPASQVVNILATTVGVVGLVHLGVDERLAPLAAAALALPVSFLAARFVITKAVLEPRPFAAAPTVTPRSTPSVGEAVTRPIPLMDRR